MYAENIIPISLSSESSNRLFSRVKRDNRKQNCKKNFISCTFNS